METINKRIMSIYDIEDNVDYSFDECDIRCLVKTKYININTDEYSISVIGHEHPVTISKDDYEQLSKIQKDNVKSGRVLQPNLVHTINTVSPTTHTQQGHEVNSKEDITDSNKSEIKYKAVTYLVQEIAMFAKDTKYYVRDFHGNTLVITKEQFEKLSSLIEEKDNAEKGLENELAEIVDSQSKVK